MSYETMKNLVKKWLLEYACKLKYEQVLHLFATTADQRSLDEVGMPQARSLLCTMLTIVTQEDLQHFDIAISVIEQLHAVSTGDVISHNQCIKLLMGLKVSFLAHLLMKGQTQILDKVNKYFPRSPPRRSDIDAKLHKTLEVMNQKSRNFFLSLLANRKMCKTYVRNCFGQEFGPPFMMKLKKLANKFEGEINSCLPPTVIEKIQQSGSNSELIKALSAEKHAVIELFLDLLHSQDTGELKEQISQGEMLDLLQLLKPPADGAKVLGTLSVHWDSIVSDDHSHKSMHPQTDTNNTCWQELDQSEKSNNKIIVMARRQKRCSGDASDEDTMSPKKLCRSGKGDRVTTTVPDPDVVTVKSPDNDMLTMTSPDHDSVTLAEPDCDAITFSARDYDTMTSQDCDSVTVIDPGHNSVTVTNHDMVTTTSPDHDMVTTTSPDHDIVTTTSPDLDMVTVMSPDHDMVTVTSPDQCTQGRIYKMKAPAPSTHISLVNSQVVSSGTSSSDRSIMSRTTSTQSEGSDSQRLQAHTQSEGSDSQRLQAYTQSESSDSRHIQAHTQSESSDNQRLQAHTQTDGSDSQHLQAHTQSEGTKSQHLQAHTQSEGSSSQRLQTTAVLTQQDRPNEGCVDEEMVLDLSPSTLACHGREEAMYVSFVSDSYSDSNLSKTLLQASDSASSDITTEPMMMFLPPLERHLKHALIRECVVKLHRNKKLDTRLPNQHVELFS